MTANEQLNYLSTFPRKAKIRKMENELNRIQKDLKERNGRNALSVHHINKAFQQIQSLFDEQREISNTRITALEHECEVLIRLNQDKDDKIKAHEERIIRLCDNIDTLEANKDAYKKQCEEQEKEIKRLNDAYDELYKLKDNLVASYDKEIERIIKVNDTLNKVILRLRG